MLVIIVELREKATPELVRQATQQAQRAMLRRALLALPEWQSDQPERVSFGPARQLLLRSRDRSESEQPLWSYRPMHTLSAPFDFLRATPLTVPCAFAHAFVRNRFHAAKARSPRARSGQTERKDKRYPAMWKMALVRRQCCELIRCRPFQLTVVRDSIRRGSRTGNSEVLGTSRR